MTETIFRDIGGGERVVCWAPRVRTTHVDDAAMNEKALDYYERDRRVHRFFQDRVRTTHVDGTPVFHSAEDSRVEREVADALERAWGCRIQSFGALSPIDWFATRDGRLSGLLELKARKHASGHYPTVFLSVRKWLALSLGACGMGVPAVFVVRFLDGVFWVPVAKVDASAHRIGGRTVPQAANDVEPLIEVPVLAMTVLRDAGA